MSSAALQAQPHQTTTVGSHSPVAATSSGRPYTGSSSQSRDGYYTQNSNNASPTTTRRPSRRPSGNGATSTTSPQQYYSPSGSTPTSAVTSRSPNQPPSPVASAGYAAMVPGDQQRGVPPVVSPRTSSNRNPAHAGSSTDRTDRSRRTHNEASNSPRQTGDGSQDRADRQRSNGNTQQPNGGTDDPAVAAANAAARARRRAQAQGDAIPSRPSGSREPRSSASASAVQRQAMAAASNTGGQWSEGPSREASEVLNRVVISKPEVDIERERERMAEAIPSSPASQRTPGALSVVPSEGVDDTGRGGSRSRHDHTSGTREKSNTKFGDYFLGNTLGEGEFGKVKMGWKQEGGVQVAIKLIRRDSVGTNPTRLAKIYREISILREISHPNIVHLHEMVETPKQIGLILEYASGGELFDYILNHRYLKDQAARRLFAQLVSGVGYLHKKGIVHRDLKLENLLLDRNRNIIITDFGFANTFNPDDELGDEIEYNLSSRDFVKRMELDKILEGGHRRGDLMQTSCGSPCYAAPELVVSDSLYTGRKVDVWSCGVILYAMLAGYLPFDDDPANPEGDNINLLYKYIVSTPLTFPEYVTPHARDLLRRILVPDPRKRADLFEVARHSWLSEYSHVVGFITSTTTTSKDVATTTVTSEDEDNGPMLGRSASVREASKASKQAAVGELGRKHGHVDPEAETHPKPSKDNKRRTVQVEYVAPRSQTQRGEPSNAAPAPVVSSSKTRARAGSASGPTEVQSAQPSTRRQVSTEKPLPQDPPGAQYSQGRRPSGSGSRQQGMPPPTRPGREVPRSVSDANYMTAHAAPPISAVTRPTTGGSMTSTGSRSGSLALRDRGSYSQPAPPSVAGTNAQGRMAQPKTGTSYNISAPIMDSDQSEFGLPSSSSQNQIPAKFARVAGFPEGSAAPEKSHKRSNTIGSMFSRTNSIFGSKRTAEPQEKPEKTKKYPPVSMSGAVPHSDSPRQSMDSRRSISFGFGKKRSGSMTGSQTTTLQDKPRRFSLLPASFSLKAIGIGKEYGTPGAPPANYEDYNRDAYTPPPHTARTADSRNISGTTATQPYASDGAYDRNRDSPRQDRRPGNTSSPVQARYNPQPVSNPRSGPTQEFLPPMNFRQGESALNTESESSLGETIQARRAVYPDGFNSYNEAPRRQTTGQSRNSGRGVLQKNNRKFTEAYEQEANNGYGPTHSDHAGSSGAARKVMDFFRRRGRDRGQ